MDQNIKDYADSAYEMSMMNSVSSLRKAKAALLTEIATRSGGLPANMARIASIHVDHVQRCISARLESYQMAFSDAGVTPSESDFKQMYTEGNRCDDYDQRRRPQRTYSNHGSDDPVGLHCLD